jgi:hypothetical protein
MASPSNIFEGDLQISNIPFLQRRTQTKYFDRFINPLKTPEFPYKQKRLA